jgi:hypothetical protein
MGQAVGVAAALAKRTLKTPTEISVDTLQENLRSLGAII